MFLSRNQQGQGGSTATAAAKHMVALGLPITANTMGERAGKQRQRPNETGALQLAPSLAPALPEVGVSHGMGHSPLNPRPERTGHENAAHVG